MRVKRNAFLSWFTMRVRPLDSGKLIRDMRTATMRGQRDVAKWLRQHQRELILSGKRPDGSTQQPGKTTEKRVKSGGKRRQRRRTMPLYETGLLARASKWRIQKTENGRGYRVLPPPERVKAVEHFHKHKYSLMTNQEIPGVGERVESIILPRINAVMPQRRRRNTRGNRARNARARARRRR